MWAFHGQGTPRAIEKADSHDVETWKVRNHKSAKFPVNGFTRIKTLLRNTARIWMVQYHHPLNLLSFFGDIVIYGYHLHGTACWKMCWVSATNWSFEPGEAKFEVFWVHDGDIVKYSNAVNKNHCCQVTFIPHMIRRETSSLGRFVKKSGQINYSDLIRPFFSPQMVVKSKGNGTPGKISGKSIGWWNMAWHLSRFFMGPILAGIKQYKLYRIWGISLVNMLMVQKSG